MTLTYKESILLLNGKLLDKQYDCLWTHTSLVQFHMKMMSCQYWHSLYMGKTALLPSWPNSQNPTHKKFYINPEQLEMHGCVHNTVATDALVLKHQTIITYCAN